MVQEQDLKLTQKQDLKLANDFPARTTMKQKNPFIFELSYQGKISYCLPVIHTLAFEQLHEKTKSFIKSLSILVSECDHEEEWFEKDETFGTKTTENYFEMLPNDIQTRIRKILVKFCKDSGHPEDYIKPESLMPSALLTLLRGESETLGFAMDKVIYQLFQKSGKELHLLDEIEDTQSELDLWFQTDEEKPLLQDNSPEQNESHLEHNIAENKPNENELQLSPHESDSLSFLYYWDTEVEPRMVATIKKYLGYEGSQDWNELGDKGMIKNIFRRNCLWIPKMIYAHLFKNAPVLFIMGGAHLYCPEEYGIFNILKFLGFNIRKMNSDGKFVDYDTSCNMTNLPSVSKEYMNHLKELAWVMNSVVQNTTLPQRSAEIVAEYLRRDTAYLLPDLATPASGTLHLNLSSNAPVLSLWEQIKEKAYLDKLRTTSSDPLPKPISQASNT